MPERHGAAELEGKERERGRRRREGRPPKDREVPLPAQSLSDEVPEAEGEHQCERDVRRVREHRESQQPPACPDQTCREQEAREHRAERDLGILPGHPRRPLGVDGAARREKRVRLVEGVGDEVHDRDRVRADPAEKEHETHVGRARVGERGLHAALRDEHHRRERRGEASDDDQRAERQRRQLYDPGEPHDEEGPAVQDPRVEERGHRRWRLLHLGQPPVRRELRRLEGGSEHDQDRSCVHRERYLAARGHRLRLLEERADVARPERPHQQDRRCDQACVAGPGDDEFLARGDDRAAPIGVEEQESVQGEARRAPHDRELHEVAREHEEHHARDREAQVAHEHGLARVAVQVVATELEDSSPERGDEAEHHSAQPVDAHREAEASSAQQCARRGEDGGSAGDEERYARRGASRAKRQPRLLARVEMRRE